MTGHSQTDIRRLGPGDEAVARHFAEPENDAANALYASLGGGRVEAVMWDFRSAGS